MARRLWIFVAAAVLAGCPDDDDSAFNLADHPYTYFSTMERLEVEVAYEAGAEPYAGTGNDGRPLWSFLRDNLEALFQGRTVEVAVPFELAEMSEFPAQGRPSWTVGQILDLALRMRRGAGTSTEGRFIVLFLDGLFDDGSGPVDDILGVQVDGSPAVAVFKPAIRSHSSAAPLLGPPLEQSTLVHELGHVLGLVGKGLPPASPHGDPEHPGHCGNSDCIMYWEISTGARAPSFARRRVLAGASVVFGSECLEDARSYHPVSTFSLRP